MRSSTASLLALLAGPVVLADYVVQVDDNDPSIQYSGSGWEPASQHPNTLDFGGGHTVSTVITDTATFTFIGAHSYRLNVDFISLYI